MATGEYRVYDAYASNNVSVVYMFSYNVQWPRCSSEIAIVKKNFKNWHQLVSLGVVDCIPFYGSVR